MGFVDSLVDKAAEIRDALQSLTGSDRLSALYVNLFGGMTAGTNKRMSYDSTTYDLKWENQEYYEAYMTDADNIYYVTTIHAGWLQPDETWTELIPTTQLSLKIPAGYWEIEWQLSTWYKQLWQGVYGGPPWGMAAILFDNTIERPIPMSWYGILAGCYNTSQSLAYKGFPIGMKFMYQTKEDTLLTMHVAFFNIPNDLVSTQKLEIRTADSSSLVTSGAGQSFIRAIRF